MKQTSLFGFFAKGKENCAPSANNSSAEGRKAAPEAKAPRPPPPPSPPSPPSPPPAAAEDAAGPSDHPGQACGAVTLVADGGVGPEAKRPKRRGPHAEHGKGSSPSSGAPPASEEGGRSNCGVAAEPPPARAQSPELADSGSAMSEYERMREENIRRNADFLASLGLGPGAAPVVPGRSAKGKRKRPKAPAAAKSSAAVPVRRSSRRTRSTVHYSEEALAGGQAAAGGSVDRAADADVEEEQEPEPEVDYDDSAVLKYVLGGSGERGAAGDAGGVSAIDDICGLDLAVPEPLTCPAGLDRLYTLCFSSAPADAALLAGGGNGGYAAVWSPGQRGDDELLLAWHAHGGWVSSVRFVESASRKVPLLLSSANDGQVRLWDLARVATGAPQMLYSEAPHAQYGKAKGIFCMDARAAGGATVVASGAKNKSVAVYGVGDRGLEPRRVFAQAHEGVVKSVCLKGEFELASAANDGSVSTWDTRSDGPCADFGGWHSRAHSARWHPVCDHLLMTAGLDAHVNLFDVRKGAKECVHRFLGHASSRATFRRAIHHPEFLLSGPRFRPHPVYGHACHVVTCGELSGRISLYCAATGSTVSRGTLPAPEGAEGVVDGAAMAVHADGQMAVALDGTGEVYCMRVRGGGGKGENE